MQNFLDFNNINIAIGSILLALSAVMFMIPIPPIERWHNFRTGRSTLAIAYIVLSVLMIANGVIGSGCSDLSGMITLIIAFFQALLYTRICILFLKLRSFAGVHYRTLLIAFSVFSIGLAVSYALNRSVFTWIFYIGLLFYTMLLIYCTIVFIKNYKETIKRLEYIYDEDMDYRVRWVKGCFYSALAIGIMAWFMAVFHDSEGLNISCMIIYTIYYLCMVGYFIRYVSNYNFILKSDEWNIDSSNIEVEPIAISPTFIIPEDSKENTMTTKEEKQLTERLDKWVEKKRYRDHNKTLDEIVQELGTTRAKLSRYMETHFNTNFRAWRNSLRIEEAKRMLLDTNLSVTSILNAVGYSDRSNFHNHFTSSVGMTPAQYRNKHKK